MTPSPWPYSLSNIPLSFSPHGVLLFLLFTRSGPPQEHPSPGPLHGSLCVIQVLSWNSIAQQSFNHHPGKEVSPADLPGSLAPTLLTLYHHAQLLILRALIISGHVILVYRLVSPKRQESFPSRVRPTSPQCCSPQQVLRRCVQHAE